MIARGAIFAALRAQMLDAFTQETNSPHKEVQTLGDWLDKGFYQFRSCSSKEICVEVSSDDVSGAILCEVENLLNHCLEHLHEIHCYSVDSRQRSGAWAVVTAYYLGFFSASAFLRLIGRPTVFFTKPQIDHFKQLHNVTQLPGAGSFDVRLGNHISSNYREMILSRGGKVHESTWKNAISAINTLLKDPSTPKQPDEAELYSAISSIHFSPSGTGYDWPSWVRNRVNYRPGNSYHLRTHELIRKTNIRSWINSEKSDIFELVREQYRRSSLEPLDLTNQIGMMTCFSMVFFALTRELYLELSTRRKIDHRWESARLRYRDTIFSPSTKSARLFFR